MYSGIGAIGEKTNTMKKILLPLGISDDGNSLVLTYGDHSDSKSANVLIEGGPGSGRQELLYNLMYYLLTNYSPKDVLVYDVCNGKEWTFTIRHYRNVRIDKTDTMLEFLKFIVQEMNDRKDKNLDKSPMIFLFFDYLNEYSLSRRLPREKAQKCLELFQLLLEKGSAVGIHLICSCSWGQIEEIDNVKQKYNTIIRIPMELLSMTGNMEMTANEVTTQSIHFKIEKTYGKNFYKSIRKQLCFPMYQYHLITRRVRL